jgi:hypothetical protein
LLAIDVGSELRTLCEAQLRGTWQVPAELVRFAVRLGATEIEVDRRRLGFRFRWRGSAVGESVLRNLRSALDRGCPAAERQQAIGALEADGAEALLWAAGLKGARLRVDCTGQQGGMTFTHRDGGRPQYSVLKNGGHPPTVELRWTCGRLDRSKSLVWLRMAVRFVDGTVRVNRRPVPRGFVGGLYHVRLEKPLSCRVGLTRSGDHPVLWLLKDGVVSARAAIPGYPAFEAAVELGGLVPGGAGSADLRRAVAPYVNELVDRAVWMMVEVAERMPEMGDRDRHLISTLLLRAARRRIRDHEVRSLPLVPTASGGENRLSVEDIRRLAMRRGNVLAAIDPDAMSGDALADPEATLVASSEIRGLLSELVGVRFQAPSRRSRRLADRIGPWSRRVATKVARRIRGMAGSRPVDPDSLSEDEQTLLAALQATDPTRKIALCRGGGKVRVSSRGLLLPRENPLTVAGAECVRGDSSWAYPVLLALETVETPPSSLRERWRRR